MTNEHRALVPELARHALCKSDHPGKAASALLAAAGEVLQAKLGVDGALAVLRLTLDDTEAALTAKYGRQPGETAQ